MASKFHHNAIFTGIIDSFCLACETYLRSEEDARRHIEKPVHKKSLDSTQLLEKFKTDHIRKVKMGYYCEFCNILFSTLTKIGIHVDDVEHIATKGLLLLKSHRNGVVAYNNTLIKDKAWHSLTEDTCAICNTEFENAEIHKNSTTHLLKLVQHKVEFGANNSVYRRMDESTFQCLTCNMVLAMNTLENHFNDPDHKDIYLKCRIEQNGTRDEERVSNQINDKENIMKKIKINDPKVPVVTKTEIIDEEKQPDQVKMNTKKTETDNKSKILDAVSRFEKSEININFEFETAFCKKCFVSISFNFHGIEKHIVEHKTANKSASHPSNVNQNHNKIKLMQNRETTKCSQPDEVIKALPYETDTDQNHNKINTEDEMETIFTNAASSGDDKSADDDEEYIDISESEENDEMVKQHETDIETSLKLAKENHITYNAKNNNAFCRVCQKRLPSTLRSMKEHVSGVPHKSRVASQDSSTANTKLPRKTSKKFIDEVVVMGNFFQQDVVVINGKYVMSNLSYLMISKHGSRLRCQVCEMSLTNDEVDDHEESYTHKRAMNETPIVTYYDSEFVREIRPGLFHCGYCNLIAGSWSDFEKHIKCPEHKASKDTASRRLEMNMPQIIAHRQQKEMAFLRMMMLGRFGRPF